LPFILPSSEALAEAIIRIASWNVNSIRARIDHVTSWLKANEPDVLLLQELKAPAFPAEVFNDLGYQSAAVTQKAYNGVAVLSRFPIETVNTALRGDTEDTHARFLEVMVQGIRLANIYLPNGNPVGSDKFAYKLAWMDRLAEQMSSWCKSDVPTLVGGDFNVIPEDIDCHSLRPGCEMPCFSRSRERVIAPCLNSDIQMRFGHFIPARRDSSRSGITFGKRSNIIAVFGLTISCFLHLFPGDYAAARSTRGRGSWSVRRITRRLWWNLADGVASVHDVFGCNLFVA
jgi:exodeoxyribonuclease III